MARIDLEALRRQLSHKNSGYSRRLALISRAHERLALEKHAHEKARDASIAAIEELAAVKDALDRLEVEFGAPRSKTASPLDQPVGGVDVFDSETLAKHLSERELSAQAEVVVIDADYPHRTIEEGAIWELPLACAPTGAPPFQRVHLAKDDLADHRNRGVAVAGYVHLAYLVQSQWMSKGRLESAASLAVQRGVVGQANAPDLIGNVVDGKAAGRRGDGFWNERRRAGLLDDEGSGGAA